MVAFSAELAEIIARRFAVLGDPTRVRLLDAIHQRDEVSVGDLAGQIGASHANVSKHLQLMVGERMLSRRRDGNRVLYRISDPTLIDLCEQVCASARQALAELHRVLDQPAISEGATPR